jgi:prepilin-type N-terminal cleavage/methylation domain-containing protein
MTADLPAQGASRPPPVEQDGQHGSCVGWPAPARAETAGMRARRAMTLTEVVIVIAIALVLVALLLPAIGVVRERAARAEARALVQQVHTAVGLYRAEELMRRFPAMPADRMLRVDAVAGQLAERGLAVNGANTHAVDAGAAVLVDPWKQPLMYHLDQHTNGDGVALRPLDAVGDAVRVPEDVTDWNPPRGSPARAEVPYAYVWSWGAPRSDHQLRAKAARWIYVAQAGSP